jgi:hypothetical protein
VHSQLSNQVQLEIRQICLSSFGSDEEGNNCCLTLTFMVKKAAPNYEKRIHSNILNINWSIARCFTLIKLHFPLK